jgi:response regulator RpfG family c-di-GMP phosphodiesterase
MIANPDTVSLSLDIPPHDPPRPPRVVFVDDESSVLSAYRRTLHSSGVDWEASYFDSVVSALHEIGSDPPDVVISDICMPVQGGFALLQAMSSNPKTMHVPVVLVTGVNESDLKRHALDSGAVDLLNKPVQAEDLIARVRSVLKIARYEAQLRIHARTLEEMVRERTQRLALSHQEIVFRLAAASDYRDTDTGLHVRRVAAVSRRLAEQLDLPSDRCEQIFLASTLHDIGKIGIPDMVLRKTGPFTAEDRRVMQSHCQIGYDILCGERRLMDVDTTAVPHDLLAVAGQIALCHHERWDGTGYPRRLKGNAIPLEARIVAVADVYDALRSSRTYKPPIDLVTVAELVRRESGAHFDPVVVEALQACWDEIDELVSPLRDAPTVATHASTSAFRSIEHGNC